MPLTDVEKRRMIAATYDMAKDMVDDLAYMRRILAETSPDPGDFRRLSNTLRRLLIDNNGDLKKIFPPRLDHRLNLLAPELGDHIGKCQSWYFGSVGAGALYGCHPSMEFVIADPQKKRIPSLVSRPYTQARQVRWELHEQPIDEENRTERTIPLPIHSFLSQRVIYFSKQWIKRADVIKYVANVGGGVHSGDPKDEPIDYLLHQVRQICSIWVSNGTPQCRINHPFNLAAGAMPIDVDRHGFDFTLIQIMAAARYVAMSPDIHELEDIIRLETRA
jgi:hypothetical protein